MRVVATIVKRSEPAAEWKNPVRVVTLEILMVQVVGVTVDVITPTILADPYTLKTRMTGRWT